MYAFSQLLSANVFITEEIFILKLEFPALDFDNLEISHSCNCENYG
jgi:hypothetical protein